MAVSLSRVKTCDVHYEFARGVKHSINTRDKALTVERESGMVELNLRQVACVLAVIDEGHFGRAAEKLFISPPALTQQVRALERKLGVELIDRSMHSLRPTEIGTHFIPHARQAVAAAERAVQATTEGGRLRIGFMTAAIGMQTGSLLDRVRREFLRSTLELVELAWPDQAPAVRRGVVDAAIVRPPVADSQGLRFDILYTEERVVALASTHPLATRTAVSIDDLDGEPHVSDTEADPDWVRWWACDPRPSGRPVTYGPSVRTIDELLEVVATGDAVAITSQYVPDFHRHPGVTFVPVEDLAPSPVCLCTRQDDTSKMAEILRTFAKPEPRLNYFS